MVKRDLEMVSTRNGSQACAQQFGYAQESFAQLRFTTERDYNLEVVCADFVTTPLTLDSKTLPPLVHKMSSSTGFMMDGSLLPQVIQLVVGSRVAWIYTDRGLAYTSFIQPLELDYVAGPLSSCQANNQTCCNLEVQRGVGTQLTEVRDCPKSCFASCLARPVVLAFNARPVVDPGTRTIEVRRGEPVTLSYVIGKSQADAFANQLDKATPTSWSERLFGWLDANQSSGAVDDIMLPVAVTIDLGDGEVWQGQELQGSLDHIYQCDNQLCFYQIHLQAADGRGVLSVDNELAKMIVRVSR